MEAMSERDRTPADAGPLALPAAGLRLAAAVSARPLLLLRRGGGWVAELGRVGLGRSDLAPDVPAGPVAPVARCVAQVLLATTGAVAGLLDDAVASPDMPLPAADAERLRATLAGLTSLLLPGAGPLVITGSAGAGAANGTAATARTGPGRQDDRGRAATAAVTDATAATDATGTAATDAADTAATDPVSPDTVSPDTVTADGVVTDGVVTDTVTADVACPAPAEAAERVFTPPGADTPSVPFDTGARDARGGPVPGRDVAATPGAVVLRTPMFELLQYLPRTEKVRDTPVLVVPPLVHRYWLADLAPGYSLVEHLLEKGLQVFALSWRPAGPADADRDLDAHAAAVLDAVDACGRITRAPRVSLLGVRTGGLLTAVVQAHQAAIGLDDRVAAVAYLATVLDQSDALPGFAPDPATVAETADLAARDGVLDGARRCGPGRGGAARTGCCRGRCRTVAGPPTWTAAPRGRCGPGSPTCCHCPPGCTPTSPRSPRPPAATRTPTGPTYGSSAPPSGSPSCGATATSWPPTTTRYSPGRAGTAPRSASAAAAGSCWPPVTRRGR